MMTESEFSLLVVAKRFMLDGGVFMWVILFSWLLGVALSVFKIVN